MRVIARLDIKGDSVIKGVNFEGLRKVGTPSLLSRKYELMGADELLVLDSVASLYGMQRYHQFVPEIAREISIPLAVGGGVASLADATTLFELGADRVVANTSFVKDPSLISKIVDRYGAQACSASIEAKFNHDWGTWEVYTEGGREPANRRVSDWIIEVQEYGVGEIILSSVDSDGTCCGPDLGLLAEMSPKVGCQFVFCSGIANIEHVKAVYETSNDLISIGIASALHFNKLTIADIKNWLDDLPDKKGETLDSHR